MRYSYGHICAAVIEELLWGRILIRWLSSYSYSIKWYSYSKEAIRIRVFEYEYDYEYRDAEYEK